MKSSKNDSLKPVHSSSDLVLKKNIQPHYGRKTIHKEKPYFLHDYFYVHQKIQNK